MKKKYIIILAAVLLVALAAAAVYVAWVHTTAWKLMPKSAWITGYKLTYHERNMPDYLLKTVEAEEAELRAVLRAAHLWRVHNVDEYEMYPNAPRFILTAGPRYAIFIAENGYVLVEHWRSTETYRISDDGGLESEAKMKRERIWYRDDGSLYQVLVEKFGGPTVWESETASLLELLPAEPWEGADCYAVHQSEKSEEAVALSSEEVRELLEGVTAQRYEDEFTWTGRCYVLTVYTEDTVCRIQFDESGYIAYYQENLLLSGANGRPREIPQYFRDDGSLYHNLWLLVETGVQTDS